MLLCQLKETREHNSVYVISFSFSDILNGNISSPVSPRDFKPESIPLFSATKCSGEHAFLILSINEHCTLLVMCGGRFCRRLLK